MWGLSVQFCRFTSGRLENRDATTCRPENLEWLKTHKKKQRWHIRLLNWILTEKRDNLCISHPHTISVHLLYWFVLLQRHLIRFCFSASVVGKSGEWHFIFPLERTEMRAQVVIKIYLTETLIIMPVCLLYLITMAGKSTTNLFKIRDPNTVS